MIGFQHLFTHYGRDSVTWEEAFIIFQHFQIKPFHPSVGGIDQPGVNQPIPNGVIDQPRVHLSYLRAIKLHLVGLLKGLHPIAAPGKFQIEAEHPVVVRIVLPDLFDFCHHLRDGGDIFRLGAFALHRERVSIVHVSRFEPYQPSFASVRFTVS